MKTKPSTDKTPIAKTAPKTDRVFAARVKAVRTAHEAFLKRKNPVDTSWDNGVFERFKYPVVTYQHAPLEWRYDFNPKTNPYFIERLGINATLNPGAFYWKGKIHLVVRTEGYDRKSFFSVVDSPNGLDNFRFWEEPINLPELKPETNVYDMRVTFHQDGWIYGVFCAEEKDPNAAPGDLSSAVAVAGLVRTKDFRQWDRLPNLRTPASQQRNVVLHPEFVRGKYAFYTRPMDGFIDVGSGGGIGWTLCDDIATGMTGPETIIDARAYHTIKEAKNGQGPAPLKTPQGWLHLAHGVRGCAAGLRYVLYMFMTSLDDPSKIIARPGGHFLAPYEGERIGDVSNVTFTNGWVRLPDDTVLIYYGGSDTRCYVARSTVAKLTDWCLNTPEDALTTRKAVDQRLALIRANRAILGRLGKRSQFARNQSPTQNFVHRVI
jgi:4-O-beta-D-mannosyl-D-glucose phosphorylase